jgi:protoporphyrinogen oxidase
MTSRAHVIVIGGGFCGLSAAYELAKSGVSVTVLEADDIPGGLAGSFLVGGIRLEKFYHHWFNNDLHVMRLIEELGLQDQVLVRGTRTGMYFAQRHFRLSTPLDLLRFSPLPFADRLRLGWLTLRARHVRDWRPLEHLTAADWLRRLGGDRVYRVVWEPLLRGKFGDLADEVSAVWFWNKIKLRGGSRGRAGQEQLLYFRGGFAALTDELANAVVRNHGTVRLGAPVQGLLVANGRVEGAVLASGEHLRADAVIATAPLPAIADIIGSQAPPEYARSLRRIRYLGNICVVLELDRSLSGLYWLNVNDAEFPFVGVIEHTNFEPASTYGGRHIVYLSKYLETRDPLYRMGDQDVVDFTFTQLRKMFPDLSREWLRGGHVWRAPHAQPLVERHYSRLLPERRAPLAGLYLATMAQVYPEDRGTNYAIREGRLCAREVAKDFAVGAKR